MIAVVVVLVSGNHAFHAFAKKNRQRDNFLLSVARLQRTTTTTTPEINSVCVRARLWEVVTQDMTPKPVVLKTPT